LAGFNRQNPSYFKRTVDRVSGAITFDDLVGIEKLAFEWIPLLVERILESNFLAIGCSTTFEQTAAAIAILKHIKKLNKKITTLLGGANCEGEMAEGIVSAGVPIDHIFSGESENTFPDFLVSLKAGSNQNSRIISGTPCQDMVGIPTVDYAEYYSQFSQFLEGAQLRATRNIWLPYESSRGCWWGQKSHCTFCGINGETMSFRYKSHHKVIDELRILLSTHPSNQICMVDNIMPFTYFKTLIPELAQKLPGLHIFYEQKANLTLMNVAALKAAGVKVIQPGIEALSSPLLELMRKGITARQNIALLRYCQSIGISVNWNLLYAFPHDVASWYSDTSRLIPFLRHLNPPTGLFHLSIDRFSPYFRNHTGFGLTNLRPMDDYVDVFPDCADAAKAAYHFVADYPSESKQPNGVIDQLSKDVSDWRAAWSNDTIPQLRIDELESDTYLLTDTRGFEDVPLFEFITLDQVELALGGERQGSKASLLEWGLKRKVVVELDGKLVALACASADLIEKCETQIRHKTAPVGKSGFGLSILT
jgi:ribosomal peptide maturation radical SAM protein 1